MTTIQIEPRAVAEKGSLWFGTAASRVQFQTSACSTFVSREAPEQVLSSITLVFLWNFYFISALCSSITVVVYLC
jgi:hypothetical protein